MSFSKLLSIVALLLVALSASAQQNAYLQKADELFKKKQFTQSFELYEQLFDQGKYSPAMLLRMAYIQEGSGHISRTLYYLTIYYKATGDENVLTKIDELSSANHLEGYTITPADRFFVFLDKYFLQLAGALIAAITLILAVTYTQKRKRRPIGILVGVAAIIMVVLFLHINFSTPAEHLITANQSTYLMAGPSSGADVIAIIPDGHQLRVEGKKDVWLRVEWNEKDVWVRESSVWR